LRKKEEAVGIEIIWDFFYNLLYINLKIAKKIVSSNVSIVGWNHGKEKYDRRKI